MAARPFNTQPRTYNVSLRSILSLPFRICNPPPAVAKVRSCGVTPLIQVRLEDVLDRKHLPPLGLKDFEEWLLYVERSEENLYFTLWLREYRTRYNQWAAQHKFQRDPAENRANWASCSSSQLAMFYARAKQTFLMPNAEYELNLPSSLLAPFHTTTESPHPDPAIFTDIAIETQRMLTESLRRFVNAQLNNVGNRRVLCGMIAGFFFCIVGGIIPIAVSFTKSKSRWPRLSAFPGLWFGLSILLASLHGVCLGVYIFGDLRQLRKFELSRPPISKPKPLPPVKHRHASEALSQVSSSVPITHPPGLVVHPPPRLPLTRTNTSSSSSSSASSSSLSSCRIVEEAMIHISPAYYDGDAVEGPATSPIAPESFPSVKDEELRRQYYRDGEMIDFIDPAAGVGTYTTTASFIYPFDDSASTESTYLPEERQVLESFDFDALPARHQQQREQKLVSNPATTQQTSEELLCPEPPDSVYSPIKFLARLQTSRCTVEQWRIHSERERARALKEGHSADLDVELGQSLEKEKYPLPLQTVMRDAHPLAMGAKHSRKEFYEKGSHPEKHRLRQVRSVPAFTVPLTRVLSPVIVRGQWEIVVRTAALAFLISCVAIGTLLGLPIPNSK